LLPSGDVSYLDGEFGLFTFWFSCKHEKYFYIRVNALSGFMLFIPLSDFCLIYYTVKLLCDLLQRQTGNFKLVFFPACFIVHCTMF
jgi:hypothetical protein